MSVGVVGFCGRNIVLKPCPLNCPVNAASGPRGGGGSVAANGAIPGWTGTSLMMKRSGTCVAALSCVSGRSTMMSFLSVVGPGSAMFADHRIGNMSSALPDSQFPHDLRRDQRWAGDLRAAARRGHVVGGGGGGGCARSRYYREP